MKIKSQGKVGSNILSICNDAALFQGNIEAGSLGSIAATNPTFIKSGTRDWSFDKVTAHRTNFNGPRRTHRVKETCGEETATWSPCSPKAVSSGFGVTLVNRPNPTACIDGIKTSKRVKTEVLNKESGEMEQRTFKLTFREAHYGCHGKAFKFVRCNGNQRVKDSRTDKLVTLAFAKSELVRMLGKDLGEKAYAHLDS